MSTTVAGSIHRIRRQRWHVRTQSQAEAFTLRQRLRAEIVGQIQAILDRVLDELVPGDEVIHISKLDVHANVRSIDELTAVLPGLFRRRIADHLNIQDEGGTEQNREPPAERLLAEESLRAALIHYLETGSFPWYVETWNCAGSSTWLSRIPPRLLLEVARCQSALGIDRVSRARVFRLLSMVSDSEWTELARAIVEGQPRAISEMSGVMTSAAREEILRAVRAITDLCSTLSRHTRLELAALAITATVSEGRVIWDSPTVATILEEILGTDSVAADELAIRLPLSAQSLFRRLLSTKRPLLPAHDTPSFASLSGGAAVPPPNPPEVELSAVPIPRVPQLSAASSLPVQLRHLSEHALPFGCVVGSVGLTLIHPFLPRFFDTLTIRRTSPFGLLSNDLPRAAALLFLLATGEEGPPEHELQLIKILLGLHLDDPVPLASGLVTEVDRQEAESLLASVIEHWSALRRTSVQGLRTSFLARRGLLRTDSSGFHLDVEPAAHDVLLRLLPWSIGVIKLPWMRKPIYTHWAAA